MLVIDLESTSWSVYICGIPFSANSLPFIEFYREQFHLELPSHKIATRHAKFINFEN